jgi:site-specific DNA-cytosine methylase
MYTVASFFAGIGGFGLAFESAGFCIAYQVEIDEYCQQVLSRHWPNVPKYRDIRDCHGASYYDKRVRTWYNPLNGSEYTEDEIIMAGKLKKLTPEQAEECVKMYDAGLSLQPIAEYFNVTRQSMWDLLRRRTTMRPQKRYGKDNHFYRGGAVSDDHAQNVVEYALQQGVLTRPEKCEECGSDGKFKDGRTSIQAHHCDYNKPLEVMWLCQKCHHVWHKNNQPIAKEVPVELPQTDVLCGGFP